MGQSPESEVLVVNYEDAVAVCETYLRSLVSSDVEAILGLFADDAVVEDPVRVG